MSEQLLDNVAWVIVASTGVWCLVRTIRPHASDSDDRTGLLMSFGLICLAAAAIRGILGGVR